MMVTVAFVALPNWLLKFWKKPKAEQIHSHFGNAVLRSGNCSEVTYMHFALGSFFSGQCIASSV